jgi:hypothetical protein
MYWVLIAARHTRVNFYFKYQIDYFGVGFVVNFKLKKRG